jgi:hypothetical protein
LSIFIITYQFQQLMMNSSCFGVDLCDLSHKNRADQVRLFGEAFRVEYHICEKEKCDNKLCVINEIPLTHPRAKIGVSGREQLVCRRRSSLGLCAERFGKPLLANRRLDEFVDGKSCGSVCPGDLGDGIGSEPLR